MTPQQKWDRGTPEEETAWARQVAEMAADDAAWTAEARDRILREIGDQYEALCEVVGAEEAWCLMKDGVDRRAPPKSRGGRPRRSDIDVAAAEYAGARRGAKTAVVKKYAQTARRNTSLESILRAIRRRRAQAFPW